MILIEFVTIHECWRMKHCEPVVRVRRMRSLSCDSNWTWREGELTFLTPLLICMNAIYRRLNSATASKVVHRRIPSTYSATSDKSWSEAHTDTWSEVPCNTCLLGYFLKPFTLLRVTKTSLFGVSDWWHRSQWWHILGYERTTGRSSIRRGCPVLISISSNIDISLSLLVL